MRRLTAVPLVALLALAGCSDDEPDAAPTASGTPAPTHTLTPLPTLSLSPSPPAATPTASPTPQPAREGDVDGDGTADTISATSTTLTVRLSGGGTATSPVSSDSPRAPKVLGSHDVDRDGRAEVFLLTASGASTQFASLYRYDGRSLRELRLGDEAARLGIGGSVTHGEGFRCTDDGSLQVHKADTEDGTTYTIRVITYRLSATALLQRGTTSKTARQGEPAVQTAYTVDCGGVSDGA